MKKTLILTITMLLLVSFAVANGPEGLHGSWDKLLKKHVENGTVDYKSFAADVKTLDSYLDQLAKTDIAGFDRGAKLAFWINAYNAYTVKLILNHSPVKSIRKISRPWKQRICKTAGKTVSLDHIEHKILRKELKEPRIHFAIVCASIGCPDLQNFAFLPEKIEDQLNHAARQFFGSPKHFYTEIDDGTLVIYISKIFRWFGEDFGGNKKEKMAFMKPFLGKSQQDRFRRAASVKFKYLSYDWNLNDKK